MRTLLLTMFVTLSLLGGAAAQAPAVTVVIETCAETPDRGDLAHALRVELRAADIAWVDPGAEPAPVMVDVFAPGCHASAGVRVIVAPPASPRLTAVVPWREDDPDRARLVALAVVELLADATRAADATREEATRDRAQREALVAALDLERRRLSEGEAERTEIARRAHAASAALARQRREAAAARALDTFDVSVGASAHAFPTSGTMLYGPALGGGVTLVDPLRVALDVSLGWGRRDVTLGSVDLFEVRATTGLELHLRRAPLRGHVALWGSAGWTEAVGHADDPTAVAEGSVDAASGGVGLGLGGGVELTREWSLGARLDVGYGFGGARARADGHLVARTGGLIASLRIEVAFGGVGP